MLIILDIDGVMVTTPPWERQEIMADGFPRFSDSAVESLSRILSETGASIVLSTSHQSKFNITEWKEIFKNRGVDVSSIQVTGALGGRSRKDEIMTWLNTHYHENIVIIDDDKSLNDLPTDIKEKCIIISPLIGLADTDASEAIRILKTGPINT